VGRPPGERGSVLGRRRCHRRWGRQVLQGDRHREVVGRGTAASGFRGLLRAVLPPGLSDTRGFASGMCTIIAPSTE